MVAITKLLHFSSKGQVPLTVDLRNVVVSDIPSSSSSESEIPTAKAIAELSGEWFSIEQSSGTPNGDRYEFRREGERYYVIRPPGGAKKEGDYFTFDGTTGQHAHGPTNTLLPNGDLKWDIDGGKWVSRRVESGSSSSSSRWPDSISGAEKDTGSSSAEFKVEYLGLWRDTGDRAMPIKMNVNPGNADQNRQGVLSLLRPLGL